jgi:hypothetical protein
MYRDADNYKQHESVVLYGVLCESDIQKIFSSLDDEDGFVPSAVGLDDLQERNINGWQKDVDHPFHELLTIKSTHREPTTTMTALDFLKRFVTCNWEEAGTAVTQSHM